MRGEEEGELRWKLTEEGVLPLIGHGENIGDVHVLPILWEMKTRTSQFRLDEGREEKTETNLVSNPLPLGRRSRLSRISLDPLLLNELVELLGPGCVERKEREVISSRRARRVEIEETRKTKLNSPHHSSQRLPHDVPQILTDGSTRQLPVELVGIRPSILDAVVERFLVGDGLVVLRLGRSELEPNDDASSSRRNLKEGVVGSRLGSFLVGVDELTRSLRSSRSGLSVLLLVLLDVSIGLLGRLDGSFGNGRSMGRNDVVVEGIFDVFGLVGSSVESLQTKEKRDASKSAQALPPRSSSSYRASLNGTVDSPRSWYRSQ